MDLQAFQRMMQIFPGVNDPSGGTGIGPGMNQPPDINEMSPVDLNNYQPRTAISDQLTQRLSEMPIRPQPGMLRRIGAGIAGFGAGSSAQGIVGGQPIGYKFDPKAADLASDKVKYGDFDNQLNDWQNQVKALGVGANEEDRANAGEVKRLANNAKNDIDQQKVEVARQRADSYQQNADTKIKEETDKHEYSMQKLADAITNNDKKLALAQKEMESKNRSRESMAAYHDAEIQGMRLRDQYRAADAEGKLKLNQLRTDSTIEYNRIRSEALQSGKQTDTNLTYDAAGNVIGKRVTSGTPGKTITDPSGKVYDTSSWSDADKAIAKAKGWK
jgi:hypothetical protein